MQWIVPSFFLVGCVINIVTGDDRCRKEVSNLGMALKGFVFKKMLVEVPHKCEDICEQEITCQSYNYVIGETLCELNNRTKEARPKNFLPDPARFYIRRLNGRAPLGSVRELPAQSCQEIRASEGKDAISNKYWLDPTGNGTAVSVYCDMKLEAQSCSDLKNLDPSATNGNYTIDPDGERSLEPFTVFCDMSDQNGVGVTVISHDSESRTHVQGYEGRGSYSRGIHYIGASLPQLASLTRVSSNCEQFIKYQCHASNLLRQGHAWWESRNSSKMRYWGGAQPGSGKCACGMTNSCADPSYGCNCDKNDLVWREDSGLLTDKAHLPVTQLRFGDTGEKEEGYHTLGKLKCYGIA